MVYLGVRFGTIENSELFDPSTVTWTLDRQPDGSRIKAFFRSLW